MYNCNYLHSLYFSNRIMSFFFSVAGNMLQYAAMAVVPIVMIIVLYQHRIKNFVEVKNSFQLLRLKVGMGCYVYAEYSRLRSYLVLFGTELNYGYLILILFQTVRHAFRKSSTYGPAIRSNFDEWKPFRADAKVERRKITTNHFKHMLFSLTGSYRRKRV